MFIYSDTQPFTGAPIDTDRMNASDAYLRHFDNFLILHLFAREGTFQERAQAEKELQICRRKMKFWKRKANFSAEVVQKGKERRLKDWKGRIPQID